MRSAQLICCLALVVVAAMPSVVRAEFHSTSAVRAAARHELELAKLDARHYWQVELPRKRHELFAAQRLTEKEIRRLQVLLRKFRPFDRFSVGNPQSLVIEDLEFQLLDARLRLKELREERLYLKRFQFEEARLRELRVAEARRRVIAIEGGEVIEISQPE